MYTLCYQLWVIAVLGSSGAVHNVILINVYLDLENPGGSGFWWGGMDGLPREQKGSVYEHQGAEVDGS